MTDDQREADRAERLKRVAELATLPKVSTAARWFDAQGEAEARARATAGGSYPTIPTPAQQSDRRRPTCSPSAGDATD
ncbi:MAG: hypothetical protein CMJ58_17375 [Planctomycetaceae bacterium]|nr:hypothetical protein [Planctomycetaceae bacterium]